MTAKDSRVIWIDLVNGMQSKYFTQEQLASSKEKLRRLKFKRHGEIVNDKWFQWIAYHYPALLKEFDQIRNNGKGQLNLNL